MWKCSGRWRRQACTWMHSVTFYLARGCAGLSYLRLCKAGVKHKALVNDQPRAYDCITLQWICSRWVEYYWWFFQQNSCKVQWLQSSEPTGHRYNQLSNLVYNYSFFSNILQKSCGCSSVLPFAVWFIGVLLLYWTSSLVRDSWRSSLAVATRGLCCLQVIHTTERQKWCRREHVLLLFSYCFQLLLTRVNI